MVANHSYITAINKCYLTAVFIMNRLHNHIIACLGFHLRPCCFSNMTQRRIILSLFSNFFVVSLIDACSVRQTGKRQQWNSSALASLCIPESQIFSHFCIQHHLLMVTVVLFGPDLIHWSCELPGQPKSFSPGLCTDASSTVYESNMLRIWCTLPRTGSDSCTQPIPWASTTSPESSP